jgi:hypothetical protein
MLLNTISCNKNIAIHLFRWNPPEPAAKWAPKILNATSRAPACPQPPCSMPSGLCPLTVRFFHIYQKKTCYIYMKCDSSQKIAFI